LKNGLFLPFTIIPKGLISLKAIIMAGGIGSRLYPITKTKPKPLVPILGTPVMAYSLALLKKHGISECAVTTRYLGDMIKAHFGDEFCGIKIIYSEEKKPLGTAGGVKAACDILLDDNDDSILIMSGDALTDIDLTEAVSFHEKNAADVTIVLKRTSDPIGYGVVVCDEKTGKIEKFTEKPDWCGVVSDTVNTGIYVIKRSILSDLNDNTFYDFSKDVFPALKDEKKRLFAFVSNGYWSDVGTMRSYYQSNFDVLYGRVVSYLPDIYKRDVVTFRDGSRSFFAGGAVIDDDLFKNGGGRNIIVGRNTVISSGAVVKDSVLGESIIVENNSRINGSVICDGSVIGEGALITSGCVLGSNTEIGSNVILLRDSFTEPYSSVRFKDLKPFESPDIVRRAENGLIIGLRGAMTHELCGRIGAALAGILSEDEEKRITLLFSTDIYGIAHAIACGCVWKGCNASLVFPGDKNLASYTALAKNEIAVFFETAGDEIVMHIYDRSSLECSFKTEEKFVSMLHRNIPVSDRSFGLCERDAVTVREYRENIDKVLSSVTDADKSNITFSIRGGGITARILEASLSDKGFLCKEKDDGDLNFDFSLNSDRCTVNAFGINLDFDTLRLVLTERLDPKSVKDGMFVLSCDEKAVFTDFTEKAGFFPLVYSRSSENSVRSAGKCAKENLWMRDGVLCAANFIALFSHHRFDKEWLKEVKAHIPESLAVSKEIMDVDRAKTMARLYNSAMNKDIIKDIKKCGEITVNDSDGEGIEILFRSDGDPSYRYSGRVKIRAMRENGIRIFAESYNAEIAEELCKAVEKKIL